MAKGTGALLRMIVVSQLVVGASGGCVIPVSVDQANSAPRINKSKTLPPLFGEILLPLNQYFEANLSVADDDLEPISARLFTEGNYAVFTKESKSTGLDQIKGIDITIEEFCTSAPINGVVGVYLLEVYVSDRGFSESSTDQRIVPSDALTTSAYWKIKCVDEINP